MESLNEGWFDLLKQNCPNKSYSLLKQRPNHLSVVGVQELFDKLKTSPPLISQNVIIRLYKKDFAFDDVNVVEAGYVFYGNFCFKCSEQMSKIWNASVVLFEYFNSCYYSSKKDVLDVGCGVGVVGISLSFASSITLQDIDEKALEYCRENVKLNKVQNARVIKSNWKERENLGEYDLIVLSDVWYDDDLIVDQLEFVKMNLSKNGVVVCCCGIRDEDVFDSYFSSYSKSFTIKHITDYGERVISSEGRCRSGIDWIDCEMKLLEMTRI